MIASPTPACRREFSGFTVNPIRRFTPVGTTGCCCKTESMEHQTSQKGGCVGSNHGTKPDQPTKVLPLIEMPETRADNTQHPSHRPAPELDGRFVDHDDALK